MHIREISADILAGHLTAPGGTCLQASRMLGLNSRRGPWATGIGLSTLLDTSATFPNIWKNLRKTVDTINTVESSYQKGLLALEEFLAPD